MVAVFGVALWQFFAKKKSQSGWFIVLFGVLLLGTVIMALSELGWIDKSEFIFGQMPFLMTLCEVTLTSVYIMKNLYDTLIERAREVVKAQALHLSEMERLHDEMGSTLSSISFLSQVAVNNLSSEIDKKRFEVIGTRTREVMDTLGDIVWSINATNETTRQTVERMRDFATEILGAQQIKLQFSIENSLQNLQLSLIQRKEIYLIFKEAINNIAKHAQATVVAIEINYKNSIFQLKIKDNDTGFDPKSVKMGSGLKNMNKRTKKIGGILDFSSTVKEGTTIALTLHVT